MSKEDIDRYFIKGKGTVNRQNVTSLKVRRKRDSFD